ncbi:MAG TPA: hypothetical protein VL422_10115 [Miltoncostaea sp.]|nr:hypothetical protein [Miltoncostaea sp.]
MTRARDEATQGPPLPGPAHTARTVLDRTSLRDLRGARSRAFGVSALPRDPRNGVVVSGVGTAAYVTPGCPAGSRHVRIFG